MLFFFIIFFFNELVILPPSPEDIFCYTTQNTTLINSINYTCGYLLIWCRYSLPLAPPPSVEKVYTAARLITVASRVAALMTFSFLRGSDSSPCDRRLRLSRPALKLRRLRRLRRFHYRSLTSQRACYSYSFIYFCRLSFSPGLRHGEAK